MQLRPALRNRKIRFVLGAVSAVVLVACSSDFTDSIGSFGPTSASAFVDSGASQDPEPEEPCDHISNGEICNGIPLECEVGLSPNAFCNDFYECAGGEWSRMDGGACLVQGCPNSYDGVVAPHTCDLPNANTLRCEFDEGTCGCALAQHTINPDENDDAGDNDGGTDPDAQALDGGAGDAGASGYVWKCAPKTAGCPRIRPRIGTSCVKPLECDYGHCVFDDPNGSGNALYLRCDNKVWTNDDTGECP